MASGLEFMLTLDAKVRGAFELGNVLGKIHDGLMAINGPLGQAEKAMGALGRAAGKAGGMLRRGMGDATKWAGRQVGGFARDTAAHFAALASFEGVKALAGTTLSMVETAGEAQRLQRVFESLMGVPKGAEMLDYLDGIANRTEFDDGELKHFMATLVQAGVPADKLKHSLGMALDIAALTDADPVATLDSVGEALARLQQKGELDFRILKGVKINEADFLGKLAGRVGTDVDTLKKQLTAGKIDVEIIRAEMMEAITGRTGKAVGGKGVEAGMGLTATLKRLRNVPSNLFEELATSPAADQLAASFGSIAEQLSPNGPIGKRIVGGLGEVFAQVAGYLKTVNFDEVAGKLLAFWESASTVFSAIVTTVKVVSAVFEVLGNAIGFFVADAVLTFEKLMDIGTWLGELGGRVDVWFTDIGTRITEGIKRGILGGAAAVLGAVDNLGSMAVGSLKRLLGIHSPSRVFEGLGEMSAEGYARGLEGTEGRVARVVDQTFEVAAPSASGRSGTGGGVTINMPITVNYAGSGQTSEASDIAQRIRDLVPGQLQSALEQLRLEMGTV